MFLKIAEKDQCVFSPSAMEAFGGDNAGRVVGIPFCEFVPYPKGQDIEAVRRTRDEIKDASYDCLPKRT